MVQGQLNGQQHGVHCLIGEVGCYEIEHWWTSTPMTSTSQIFHQGAQGYIKPVCVCVRVRVCACMCVAS